RVHRFDRDQVGRATSAALARAASAFDALEHHVGELARAAASLGDEGARLERSAWAELLRDSLSEEAAPSRGARGSAVQLVELRELPGRSFDHLVVVGLVAGELPARPVPDPLLSDDDK